MINQTLSVDVFSGTGVISPTNGFNCPRCGQRVDPLVRVCPGCGVDLAVAAVLAEQSLALPGPSSSSTPLSPEILVPKLGEILLEKGVISPADLQRALDIHQELTVAKKPRLLGQLLLDLSLIDRETLDGVITEQILKLHAALQQSNQQLEQRVQERTADLQNALNKLSELSQLKSNFISTISHELRTPLTHLKGYLDLLSDGSLGELGREQKDAVDALLRAETRLERLIDDLLRFSLAGRGEFTLNRGWVNVKDLVAVSEPRAGRLAKARNITLSSTLPEDLPRVLVDDEKMAWVILQLLDNAIKFTLSGGQVAISATIEGNAVKISVTDTGIGIPADRIEEIFEPFHQLDSSDTRRYGGTGLGLALVRRILEAHGSFIKVQSEVGRGSCFEFSLPAGKEGYVR